MIRVRAKLWIALVLLVVGHAPAFASIGLGLHLAGHDDHARDPHAGHAQDERHLALVLAATHGHHHELDVAAHDHTALRLVVPSAPVPQAVALAEVMAAPAPTDLVDRTERWGPPPRPGPPELFYRHSALLL